MKTFGTLDVSFSYDAPSSEERAVEQYLFGGASAPRQRRGVFKLRVQPHVALRLKRIFPRVATFAAGTICMDATDEIAFELQWFMQRYPLEMGDRARKEIARLVARYERAAAIVEEIREGTYVPPKVELALPARDYQLVPAAMVRASGGLLVGDDVGVGKTVQAIVLAATPDTLPMLFVSKTDLPSQIQREFARFAPSLSTYILQRASSHAGDRPQDLAARSASGLPMPDVVLCSYSKLAGWGGFLEHRIRTVVFDEVQELRGGTGTRTNPIQKGIAARRISQAATYRMGLSATPIYNHGDEIYAVLSFLAPDALGTREEFLREWCADGGKVTNPDALGVYLRDRGLLLRRTRADVGRELPPVTITEHAIGHDPKALEEIAGQAAELARFILEGGHDRGEAMTAGGELDWKLRQATGLAKAPFVAEFVRLLVESGEKVLLFGWHHAVYDVWRERLANLSPAFFTGKESPLERQAAIARFTNGETSVLVMSLRAGAGLDGLQYVERARNVVFGELDWSPGVHEQCLGRLARDGQPDPVTAYFMVTDDGADPIMAEALGLKSAQIRGLRDPNAPKTSDLSESVGDKARTLAERFLRQRNLPIPERAAPLHDAPPPSLVDAPLRLALLDAS